VGSMLPTEAEAAAHKWDFGSVLQILREDSLEQTTATKWT